MAWPVAGSGAAFVPGASPLSDLAPLVAAPLATRVDRISRQGLNTNSKAYVGYGEPPRWGIALGAAVCAWASSRFRTSKMRGRARLSKSVRRAVTTEWKSEAQDDRKFESEGHHVTTLLSDAKLPAGFRVGTSRFHFSPAEVEAKQLPMDLTLISLDEPTDAYAAVFTQNAFPGSPVLVGRRRLAEGAPVQAVVINNKISNVFPAGDGEAASEAVCAAAAKELGLAGGASSVLPSSTGVIGWRLPVQDMINAMPAAAATLQDESFLPVARGIMTTDRYPKVSAASLPGGARIVGVAKGAGMVQPNMATMLCYLVTDADLPIERAEFQAMLKKAVQGSLNSISVDGDESTSDTTILLSSRRTACDDVAAFSAALEDVCKDLAAQIVRNGEGTEHVMRVSVTGAVDEKTAREVGRAVVNGPLFKSAVAGNDPNVGRLVGKVGQALSQLGGHAMAEGCVCSIGGEVIFEGGKFTLDSAKEKRLSAHLKNASMDTSLTYPHHHRVVDIGVALGGGGDGCAVVLGSDLTKEYVSINADYRS